MDHNISNILHLLHSTLSCWYTLWICQPFHSGDYQQNFIHTVARRWTKSILAWHPDLLQVHWDTFSWGLSLGMLTFSFFWKTIVSLWKRRQIKKTKQLFLKCRIYSSNIYFTRNTGYIPPIYSTRNTGYIPPIYSTRNTEYIPPIYSTRNAGYIPPIYSTIIVQDIFLQYILLGIQNIFY